MELHLDDPKSKGDDLGVVVVDVCLMFRDATIKRSPVREVTSLTFSLDAFSFAYSLS